MANKPTYTQLSGDAVYSAADLNTIFDTLATAIEAGLGRQGTKESPNSMSGELDLNLSKIINLAACTADKDAANKKYVDDTVTGASIVPSGVISTTKTAGAAVSWDALLSEYVVNHSDIAANLKNITGMIDGDLIYLQGKTAVGDGGEGHFRWDASDLSAQVTDDTEEGIYIPWNTDPTGATGAWVRQYNGQVNVKWFGAAGDGTTDDTGAFAASLSHKSVYIPAGTYRVDSITVGNDTRICTDGFNTILFQNSGLSGDIRLINIDGSNVYVDDISLKGNSASDTGEQRHGIIIQSLAKELSNIHLGDVYGVDLRGDIITIAGNSSYNPVNISIGVVTGDNIYRQGVSITGGSGIDIVGINVPTCGAFVLDIEPDTAGGIVSDIRVGYIKGRQTGLLGHYVSGIDKHISLGNVDLDGSLSRPMPSIPATSTDAHGLVFRNTRGVTIEHLTIANQNGRAIHTVFGGSDVYCDAITIKHFNFSNCLVTTHSELVSAAGIRNISFGSGKYTVNTPASQYFLLGFSSGSLITHVKVAQVVGNSKFAAWCRITAEQLDLTFSGEIWAIQNLTGPSSVKNSVWDVGLVSGYNASTLTLDTCDITWSGSLKYAGITGNAHMVEINCIVTDNTSTTLWSAIKVDDVAMIQP